ncbi:MAG: 3-deoxy-D-manno-octulosonic acid transferase [Planctomycetes bacterium]|nr:3-deoxy-D-manno-octulosonic acid transferase [Planctomycetota bacterium]
MKLIINTFYLLALAVISPKIVYRMVRHDRYRAGWGERLGNITRLTDKKCIWIHAVSVGEVNATRLLVEKLSRLDGDYEIVISATTDTGYARANAIYDGKLKVFYFPFDISWIMQKAFDNIRPDICLSIELEVWPNLTMIANKRNIPVVVINGRLSDRSFPRYKLIRPVTRWMFSKVSLLLAQTEEYAQRFRYLGCPAERVVVTSSLKYDTAEITDVIEGADALAEKIALEDERLWVAGGTGPGEEKIVLDVFTKLKELKEFADLRMAVVPRKPERFDEVANMIEASGFSFVRYSKLKGTDTKAQNKPEIILGDTMGDLKKFYSLASIVFVGRTLVPMGGSDMMESAALGKCTIFGEHTFNFKQSANALLAGNGAIKVKDGDELFEAIKKCLTDIKYSGGISKNGREVISRNQGATEKTVTEIAKLLS